MPKYPNITVDFSNQDGNAFAILGTVKKALERGGVSKEEVSTFIKEATTGDYDHVLMTVAEWVDISFGSSQTQEECPDCGDIGCEGDCTECPDCGSDYDDCECDAPATEGN